MMLIGIVAATLLSMRSTVSAASASLESLIPPSASHGNIPCGEARLRCAYRKGCGAALSNYMIWCSDVLSGSPDDGCPESCENALVALTSTEEGKELMSCECNDASCLETKARVDVCRAQVLRASRNTTMSCRLSQLICTADAECSTALDFYHRHCRSMFHGKKCSHRCRNSINILRRQRKAAKLASCRCDGREEYECRRVQNNMARLCFEEPARGAAAAPGDAAAPAPPGAAPVPGAAGPLRARPLLLSLILTLYWLT